MIKYGLSGFLLFISPILFGQDLFKEVSKSNNSFTQNHSAHGVAVSDYDNDGDDDFLILNSQDDESIKLFRNNGDFQFAEVAFQSGIDIKLKSRIAVWFDADNDGWLDLYIGSTNVTHFFRNMGDGTFSDLSENSGLKTVSFNMSFMVGDLNGDQWLDLYSANLFEESQLFLNHGNLQFYNHIKGSGAETGRLNSMGGIIMDYDQDGDQDIYCVYDQFEPNKLFQNQANGSFLNVAPNLDLDFAGFGMGVDVADFNHDTKFDFYLSYYGNNALLIQQPNGTFSEVAMTSGVIDPSMSWGVVAADFNNDTHSDLFLANGLNTSGINRLFYNQGNATFNEIAPGIEMDRPSNSYGCAVSDLNGDGHQDLIVANTGNTGIQVFKNLQTGNYLELTLVGINSNKHAIGSRIEAVVDGVSLIETITAGSGYASQNSSLVHFGLGNSSSIDSLIIIWPDGSKDAYGSMEGNRRLLAIEHTSLTVFTKDDYVNALTTTSTLPLPVVIPPNSLTSELSYSTARIWNEALLDAIRNDLARPTVHARNLFHSSIALYDSWAAYDEVASPYFLGHTIDGFSCFFTGISSPENKESAQEEAMSYAAFRLLNHRFKDSPSASTTLNEFSKLFRVLGYDEFYTSTDYSSGSAAALGNYLGEKLIEFGLQDGSNEANGYANQYYHPKNEAFFPLFSGDSTITDPNHWQPLAFETFIDQSGNPVGNGVPEFLSPEWGWVTPFALKENDLTIKKRDGHDYLVYHDPGGPPTIEPTNAMQSEAYKWNFSLVGLWSSHLDPMDETIIDISPKSQGNISKYPLQFFEYKEFYNEQEGGDNGKGYTSNPITGAAYEPQLVKRSDYARVLAEFWADGPRSETPPGHWFTILNYVSDHPLFEKKMKGQGSDLSSLEFDVKAYFMLGGAMHDAAITAWGIKGYYDYIRPISAIRYMVQKGQCSAPSLPNYDPAGIPLVEGFIELIQPNDPLVGAQNENLNKIKIRAWKGPHFIDNPDSDVAGVDWILGTDWSPYQRPTFVTPPFAGYISGHSTFSRAAAEVLSLLTGSEYFPGGMSEFKAGANEFLVFEEGPTEDIILQWAKYKDASDQCSLSRIWGGIHPPADDIPGRIIGQKIGSDAFEFAQRYFSGVLAIDKISVKEWMIYPNPVSGNHFRILHTEPINSNDITLMDLAGRKLGILSAIQSENHTITEVNLPPVPAGIYLIKIGSELKKILVQ